MAGKESIAQERSGVMKRNLFFALIPMADGESHLAEE